MENIIETITKKLNQIANQKKELNSLNEDLVNKQKEILEKMAIIKELKAKNDDSYKTVLEEAKKLQQEHEILYNRYQEGKQIVEKSITELKSNIIKNLKYKKSIIKKYNGVDLTSINMDVLKKEEQKIRKCMIANKISKEKFEKLSPEQQKKITKMKEYYKDNKKRFNAIREVVNYTKLVGDKNPEDVLERIEDVIYEIDDKFSLENIDKITSVKLNEENSKAIEGKNPENNENIVKAQELENEIKEIKSNLLKNMKLLDTYKDNPTKLEEITRKIRGLEEENKVLYEKLNNIQVDDILQKTSEILGRGVTTQNKGTKAKDNENQKSHRIMVKFDIKTGKYIYIDENGKKTYCNAFEEKEGKYIDCIPKETKKKIIEFSMKKGLTKKQAKKLDDKICAVLKLKNPELLNKYIESVKEDEEFDKGFDIVYDLRKRKQKIEQKIGYRNLRNIMKKAKAHSKLGIAEVLKDKSRTLLYGLLGGTALTAIGSGTLNNNLNKDQNQEQPLENVEILDNGILKNDIIDNSNVSKEKEQEKDNINKEQQEKLNDEKNSELKNGDYVKISKSAMLFANPSDLLRIKQGVNANERIYIKNSSLDKLYKVDKIEYLLPNGDAVVIGKDENLEDVLAKKGLDKSSIENKDVIKVCHTIAEGVAQWVETDEIEKVELKVDKLGNVVEKTEEEKALDEAMENYYKQKETLKQQTNTKSTNNAVKSEEKSNQKSEQAPKDIKQQDETKKEGKTGKNNEVIFDDSKEKIVVFDESKINGKVDKKEDNTVDMDELESEVISSEEKNNAVDIDNLKDEVVSSETKGEVIIEDDER